MITSYFLYERITYSRPDSHVELAKLSAKELLLIFMNTYITCWGLINSIVFWCQHGLTLTSAWISSHIQSDMWGVNTYPYPKSLGIEKLFHSINYGGCDHFSMLRLKLYHVSEKVPWSLPITTITINICSVVKSLTTDGRLSIAAPSCQHRNIPIIKGKPSDI